MSYLTLQGIISVQQSLSGELSQDVLVLVGRKIAEEVIEARDGHECLLNKLQTFVEKVEGKQLSTNDYTNTDKAKVDNIPVNITDELSKKLDKGTFDSKMSELSAEMTDIKGLIEDAQDLVNEINGEVIL